MKHWKMENEKFLLDIKTQCGDIANEILNAAIETEETFKCKWPNRNFFLIDTKFWVAFPDILMPSRMVWMASNFSSLWSPFVFKMLGSCESSLIKQLVISDILCWTSCSFISVLLIEGETEAKTTGFTSFARADLQFSGRVTLVNRFLSAVSERVSLKATDTTSVTSSDASSLQFSLAWL